MSVDLTVQDSDVVWTLREEGDRVIAETQRDGDVQALWTIVRPDDVLGPWLDLMREVESRMHGQGYACAWVESPLTRTRAIGYGHVSHTLSLGVGRLVFRKEGR